jgi:hypothetical protein
VAAHPLLQLWGEALNPAVHSRVIHHHAAIGEHGLGVAVVTNPSAKYVTLQPDAAQRNRGIGRKRCYVFGARVSKYPTGEFAILAKAKLAELSSEENSEEREPGPSKWHSQ